MSGDYLFPKRKFKKGEPLDKVELNDALQVAAERLNGHLGPHNIRAPLATSLSSAAGTFFRTKTVSVGSDPLLVNGAGSTPGKSPQPGAAGAFLLEQTTGWQPVTGAEDMLIAVSTGASSLAITAQAAHCLAGDFDGTTARFRVTVPRFTDPDLKSGGGKSTFAELDVIVTLDSFQAAFTNLLVRDSRNFASAAEQSKEVARLIAAGAQSATYAPSSDAEKVVTKGWVEASGYEVKAAGRDLIFTNTVTGAVSGTFKISFAYSNISGAGNPIIDMTEVREGSTSSVFEALSDLPSATTKPGAGTATAAEVVVYYPAQIQYALRVDGVVITETITGRFDNEQAPLTPARIVDPRDTGAVAGISGPMLGRFRERPDAINIPMFCARLTASVDVEPGDHVVELVVRRVPTGRRRSFTPPPPSVGDVDSSVTYLPAENKVYVYSRQLAVTDIPAEPVESSPFGTPSVVASYSDEDVVTKKNLVDQRLQKVADESNDIQAFQVARGAINGDHLQGFSSVIAAASGTVGVSIFTSASNAYAYPPGPAIAFGNQRFFHPVPSSWLQMATADLPVDATPPVECVLTVEGNVFIERLVHSSLTQNKMHLGAACFLIAIRSTTTGVWYAWRPSLAWVNSNNYIAYQVSKTNDDLHPRSSKVGLNYLSRYGPNGSSSVVSGDEPGDFVDVPVTAYVDFSGVVAGSVTRALGVSIDQVAIFGAAAWMGPAGSDTVVRCRHSTINAVVMKS